MNKCILKQVKPETTLEAKMTKLKLFYFWNIMRRQGSLEETILLRKLESSRKKVKTKYEINGLNKRSHKHESIRSEQHCWGQDIMDIIHL